MKKLFLGIAALSMAAAVFAEDLSLVTFNAWPAMSGGGIFIADNLETEEVRAFRHEVLISGLEKLDPDIIVLGGLNPVGGMSNRVAEMLDLSCESAVSKSGLRIGPVSIPINLKSGDAILSRDAYRAEPAGRKSLGGGVSTGAVTLFARNGMQIMGVKLSVAGRDLYVFSAEWAGSCFSDKAALRRFLGAYEKGSLSSEQYVEAVTAAVDSAEERRSQAAETLAFINGVAGEAPVVLCGSLNTLPGSPELKTLLDAGFRDAWTLGGRGNGYTFAPETNTNLMKADDPLPRTASRVDYILIRGKGLSVRSAEVVLNKAVYGVFPSDRYGLKAVLRLSELPSSQ